MRVLLLTLITFTLFAQEGQKRDYFAPLSSESEANISYIIDTLGSHSTLGLAFYSKSLNQAGNNVDFVHPLTFIGFIFSNPHLSQKAKQIASTPWSRFTKGVAGSFDRAAQRHNITPDMVTDFAKKVNIPEEEIEPLIAKRQWIPLMNTLRNR
ncbi:MAG: hypothetical protein KDK65_00615 [Chlamydiia bacterium]|nr:hypothetical protein [Chlamydiia bacterium]